MILSRGCYRVTASSETLCGVTCAMPRHHPPSRFKKPSLLIVGCGDVGLRVAALLRGRWRLLALTSTPRRVAELHAAGIMTLAGNLDQPQTLQRLRHGLADRVLHLAPPQRNGLADERTRALLNMLAQQSKVKHLIYGSTTGVYGDAQGRWLTETQGVNPETERAQRRVNAETQVRRFGLLHNVNITILRIPGIYAFNRAGGHPRERLAKGSPVLTACDDVYTNHIHADDLARAIVASLYRGGPQQTFNVCDDTDLKMGDYFDLAADLCQLQRPPRISRDQAQQTLPAMQFSFMSESRRLHNQKLKKVLRFKLLYPTVTQGLLVGSGFEFKT
jgi:nucleoside-diphosphate-sugar epimerase